MRVVPRNYGPKIAFFKNRLARWAERAEEIGTTPDMVALVQAAAEEAREALLARDRAESAARAARLRLRMSIAKLAKVGGVIVRQVHARAEKGDAVYSQALISPPKKRAPMRPPGQPYGFEVELTAIGSLVLRWKCRNPRGAVGTAYHVWRRIGNGAFENIGGTGRKKFVDETVPPGTASIVYRIRAVRGKTEGQWARFDVHLGTSGGPMTREHPYQWPPCAA